MWLRAEHERELSLRLKLRLKLAAATMPADPRKLMEAERRHLARFENPKRRETWLRGRAALKKLLAALGRSEDTSAISFPNPWCSLTHSGPYAVAVGTNAPGVRGVGVDLEIRRRVAVQTARFFLKPEEQRQATAEILLRLWTVKEAVYKSDPENCGRGLFDYNLKDPTALSGQALVRRRGEVFVMRYAALELRPGPLSVAVFPGEVP